MSATGVEMLSVPLTTTGQGQRYNVQNLSNPETPYNLSGQTLTIRAYAPGAIGGDMSVFFRSLGAFDSPPTRTALSSITAGFIDVQIAVPAATGSFDPTMVDVIRIEIEADGNFGSTFQTPATIVYIDSVTSSGGTVSQLLGSAPGATQFASSGARTFTLDGGVGPTNSWLAQYP
jgi:hypothetical protein